MNIFTNVVFYVNIFYMSNIINIISPDSIGGTFLDWSIHYLSGHTKFYSMLQQSYISVCSNPMTNKNAHNHLVNRPGKLSEVQKYREKLVSLEDNTFETMYSYCKDNTSAEIKQQTYNEIWNDAYDNNDTLILLDQSKIHKHIIIPGTWRPSTTPPSIEDDYLPTSFDKWAAGSERWDYREYLALNIDFYKFPTHSYFKKINRKYEHISLTIDDMMNLPYRIEDICAKLSITIKSTKKFTEWEIVYNKWREFLMELYLFNYSFDDIIDGIVSGNYYDFSHLKLSIWHEALILHTLIYKYNLNIKSYGISELPTNSQYIHKLLEPNIHNINNNIMNINNYDALS